MDWETLLNELWSYVASDPDELEKKIRSCLKGHSSDGLLQAISILVTQEQYATARKLLTEFLKSHKSADDIRRRLELILHFKKHHSPQTNSIKSKQRSKELLIKDVNDLVASGELQSAESLLLEVVDIFEEPDSLNLLSRLYMLQRRPIDGAKAMQRALLLKRQHQAFVEIEAGESTYYLPTDSDLAFLNDSAEHLTNLESLTALASKAMSETADDSFSVIRDTVYRYPSLKTDGWWEGKSGSPSSEVSTFLDEPEAGDASNTSSAATDDTYDEYATEDENALPSATKTILKLAIPRRETEAGEGLAKVKVFNKSGRSLPPIQLIDLGSPEQSNSDGSSLLPKISSAPTAPTSFSQTHDEISDESDEDEDEDEDSECPAPTELTLNTPNSPQPNLGFEDPEDPIDLGKV
ncbi:hypothetical protein [Pseudomonas amygdali]|uniref:hypothetical protein n=1 Tax=Pseudomonas amygdali TaxID=47877 RepID=UPI000B2B5073|nr:hypothetical protein [Pseudomonas amygdali]